MIDFNKYKDGLMKEKKAVKIIKSLSSVFESEPIDEFFEK